MRYCIVLMVEQTRVSPDKVWQFWVKAHAVHGQGFLESGAKGHMQGKKKVSYQIIDVIPGRSFSILWKAFLVRLIFCHTVTPTQTGSEIRYDFWIEGPFAWVARLFLMGKIRANLSLVLKAFVRQLEAR